MSTQVLGRQADKVIKIIAHLFDLGQLVYVLICQINGVFHQAMLIKLV
jgi:hypothetical protein